MTPTSKDDAILAAMLKSFDSGTKKVDMTAFAANMGYGNVGSASNTFTRMKAKYSLQVERVTLPGAGLVGGRLNCPTTQSTPGGNAKTTRSKKGTITKQAARSSSGIEESAEDDSAEEYKGEEVEEDLDEF